MNAEEKGGIKEAFWTSDEQVCDTNRTDQNESKH